MADKGYCWGDNNNGKLGYGSTFGDRYVPTAVAGALSFRQVTAGNAHTCGVTVNQKAYCWGSNSEGGLGDGTTSSRASPRAVAGGLTFTQAVAAAGHSCGVTTGHVAYCWGDNFAGRLGDGTTTDRVTPTPVAGGIRFDGVAPGGIHSCGVTALDRVYCWGRTRSASSATAAAPGRRPASSKFPAAPNPSR